jgi:hypothetical protein
VVLALQLPFTLIPLIKATSSRALMGAFASGWALAGLAWGAGAAVFLANLSLFVSQLMPGVHGIPELMSGGGCSGWAGQGRAGRRKAVFRGW